MEQENQIAQHAPEPLTMKSLLEAGVHFGHQTGRWNPRMKPFIFTQRNGIHIVDLQQTLTSLEKACGFVRDLAAHGGAILFVGTKKQAQEAIWQEASRCGMFYVDQRWLGGTLTNFQTIQTRIDYLVRLEDQMAKRALSFMTKRETGKVEEEISRLNRYFGGIKALTQIPTALFIVDVGKEKNAIAEARRMGVAIVALVDTDADPTLVDYPIPGNDDAIRSVKLVTSHIAQAVIEGINERKAKEVEVEVSQDMPQTQQEEVLALALEKSE